MRDVCWPVPVCLDHNTHVKLSTHQDGCVCVGFFFFLQKRRRAEFPLQKDTESGVGYLAPPSPSFLLYSFGSARSRGDVTQPLSFCSHNTFFAKIMTMDFLIGTRWLLDKPWKVSKLRPWCLESNLLRCTGKKQKCGYLSVFNSLGWSFMTLRIPYRIK